MMSVEDSLRTGGGRWTRRREDAWTGEVFALSDGFFLVACRLHELYLVLFANDHIRRSASAQMM
jgi:hypothetical protein